jgi:hypothetical protein
VIRDLISSSYDLAIGMANSTTIAQVSPNDSTGGVMVELPYKINLLRDGSVVTRDGEYLGTWHVDEETDAFYVLVPDGAEEQSFMDPFIPGLCSRIEEWVQTHV